jgi:hypothetical protein
VKIVRKCPISSFCLIFPYEYAACLSAKYQLTIHVLIIFKGLSLNFYCKLNCLSITAYIEPVTRFNGLRIMHLKLLVLK